MSRHRMIRNSRAEDFNISCSYEDEDMYGSYGSPLSPSLQGYLRDSVDREDAERGNQDVPPELLHILKGATDDEQVIDCVAVLADYLDPYAYTWADMVDLSRSANYDPDRALVLASQSKSNDSQDQGDGDEMFAMDLGGDATPTNPESTLPSNASTVAKVICSDTSPSQRVPSPLANISYSHTSHPPGLAKPSDAIKPFAFDTPSPDDVVIQKQQQAFIKHGEGKNKNTDVTLPISHNNKKDKDAKNSRTDKGKVEKDTPSKKDRLRMTTSDDNDRTPKKIVKLRSVARAKVLHEMMEEDKGKQDSKPLLNMVVIGHVDAGKSTMFGHMLHLRGVVDQRTVHKCQTESKREGKSSFAFAWLMDAHSEERTRGITMDVAVNFFETDSKHICLLDAPGHKDFVPNMITGAAQADVAVLVVNSTTGEFESGFQKDGQTKEHAILARSLGVGQMVVAINKMDTVSWSQERYEEIKGTISPFLKSVGFRDDCVRYIPVSGLSGDNLESRSDLVLLTSWYSGPSLLEAIDTFKLPEREPEKPLRICISDIYKGVQGGSVLAGKIQAGNVAPGDQVMVIPSGEIGSVKYVRSGGVDKEYAVAGDNVDLSITHLDMSMIRIGAYLCDPENPMIEVSRFHAKVITFGLPVPITKGHAVIVHTQNVNEPGNITKLISILDRAGDVEKSNPRCIGERATAMVEITMRRPLGIEQFAKFKSLGRFTLRSGSDTIAAGIVTKRFRKKKSAPAS